MVFRCGHADRTCGKLKRTDYSHAGDNDPFKYPGSSYVLSWDQCPVYSGVTASGRIWKYIFADIFISAYFTDEILNVIFGGVIYGTSIVIALRGNASTGGTDFIALYVSNKTGKSIWSYVFFGNALMYCVYGVIFGWKFAGYSIIFQFISTHMISAFHHRYDLVTLQATTEKGPEVVALYIKHFRHGISCVEAVGDTAEERCIF